MSDEELASILADIKDLAAHIRRLEQPTRSLMTSTLFLLKQKIIALQGANTDERCSPDSP